MKRDNTYILTTVPLIVYIGTVFFFCLYNFSGTDLNLGEYLWGIRKDRFAHFFMFFPYPFVCWLFFNYNKHIKIYRKYTFRSILLSGIVLSAITEITQEVFTSSREGDPYDLGADVAGIVTGTLLAYLFRNIFSRLVDAILGLSWRQ